MVLPYTLASENGTISTYSMVDSGATGRAFIDISFAQFHQLKFIALDLPQSIPVVDGRTTAAGAVTHVVRVPLVIDSHVESIEMFATKLGHYPIILAIPWLQHHDPVVRFKKNTMHFDSPFCRCHYLVNRVPLTIHGLKNIPDTMPPYRRLISSRSEEGLNQVIQEPQESSLNLAKILAPFQVQYLVPSGESSHQVHEELTKSCPSHQVHEELEKSYLARPKSSYQVHEELSKSYLVQAKYPRRLKPSPVPRNLVTKHPDTSSPPVLKTKKSLPSPRRRRIPAGFSPRTVKSYRPTPVFLSFRNQ